MGGATTALEATNTKTTTTRNGINQGFTVQDQYYLRHYDSPEADPQAQLFVAEDLEEEEPELSVEARGPELPS